ncbi:hypothetical protein C0J52_02604 [Blattella germanica]|nr:hypothetical protein C0J52_02604 [Blattella germanica]
MLQRYLTHFTIIIISLHMARANELLTEEPTVDENVNFTIVNAENTIVLPPIFDITQYEIECSSGIIIPRWPCEEEANLWKEYGENTKRMSMELCQCFQEVLVSMMHYSCSISPSLAKTASNLATSYIQQFNVEFPENITNPQLKMRKQEYIQSFETVSKMKEDLNFSEEVREDLDKLCYLALKVHFHEECTSILNTTKVNLAIDKERNLLKRSIDSYVRLVENWTLYVKQQNLENFFNSGEIASLHNSSFYVTIRLQQFITQYSNMRVILRQKIQMLKLYLVPVFIAILLTVGLTGNLLLLAIFIKYKEMRTVANLMIMNLTATDCISLLVNLPVAYKVTTWQDENGRRAFHFIRITRFLAVKIFPKAGSCTIGNKTKTFLMVASVWLLGVLYNIQRLTDSSIEEQTCTGGLLNEPIIATIDFVVICILPSILIALLSAFTSSNIKTSALNVPGERMGQQQLKKDRMISAKVLTGLAILFVISYFPFFTNRFISMCQRSYPQLRLIIIITISVAYANEFTTEEPTDDKNINYTIVTSFPTFQIPIDGKENTNSYNEYETITSNTEKSFNFPNVFDVTQYENDCPPGNIVPRWPCEDETNLWKEYGENMTQISIKLCDNFQDVIDDMMYYSCYVSPSLAKSAFNRSTIYIENCNIDFPDNITNPQLEKRKQEYIKSFETVTKLKQALNLSEQLREGYMKMRNGALKVDFLDEYKGALNRSEVYFKIEEEQNLLKQAIELFGPLVENLVTYLEQHNLENVFNSGKLAILANRSLNVLIPIKQYMIEDNNMRMVIEQKVDTLRTYINPLFIAILLTVGLIGNILLLSIFIKYKDMRTIANFMIINLTVTDCISLLINLPAAYIRSTSYWHDVMRCRGFHYIRIVVVIVSTYSIVMISLQRYLAVKIFSKDGCCTIGNRIKTFIMALSVWVFGLLYSIPRIMESSIEQEMCADVSEEILPIIVSIDFVFICILPSVLIVALSAFTASNIKTSALNVPGERTGQQQLKKDRMLSAHVLTGLAVLFVISYFPYFIFQFIAGTYGVYLDNFSFAVIDTCVYYLLFTNSCLNPVALAIMSKKFRKYYTELFGCFKFIPFKLFEGQSTSIGSVSTTESSI